MKGMVQLVLVVLVLALAVPLSVPGGALREAVGAAARERVGAGETRRDARRVAKLRPKAPTRPRRSARRRTKTAIIAADGRGHFHVEARINRRSVEVLIDTGASSIAMSRATARRLGLRVRRSDFRHTANTANGRVEMALATLDHVRIGDVELEDVEAAVLPDGALDGVLLGMSFLGRLERFGVEAGTLVLEQ